VFKGLKTERYTSEDILIYKQKMCSTKSWKLLWLYSQLFWKRIFFNT